MTIHCRYFNAFLVAQGATPWPMKFSHEKPNYNFQPPRFHPFKSCLPNLQIICRGERNEVWTVSQQLVAVVVKCVVNQFLNIFSESILNEATTVCQWALSHQCVATFSELPLFFFLLQNIIVKRKGILCQKEHAMNKLLPIFLQAVCCCKSVIKKANGEWHMAC